ncbi:MAG: hypothetical protein LBC13_02705 [Clostridiales bacterium]|jgi:hypothetical protein|nr:hypothetical protein [Clostridiales bacterium]
MKKLRLKVILLAVLAVLMIVALSACVSDDTEEPAVPDNTASEAILAGTMPGVDALVKLYDSVVAMKRYNEAAFDPDFINFDFGFNFSLERDGVRSIFDVVLQGAISTINNSDSRFKLELIRSYVSANGISPREVLIGIYMYDGVMLIDSSGIKGGKHVAYIDSVNFSSLFSAVNDLWYGLKLNLHDDGTFSSYPEEGTEGFGELIGYFLRQFSIDLGGIKIGDLLRWVGALMLGNSEIYDLGGGIQRMVIPLNLGGLLSTLLNIGLVGDLLKGDMFVSINNIAKELIGLDVFNLIETLKSVKGSIVCDTNGGRFMGANVSMNVQPVGESPLLISAAINKIQLDDTPIIDIPEIDTSGMTKFSPTALSMDAKFSIVMRENHYTVGDILGGLGGILGLIGGLPDLSGLNDIYFDVTKETAFEFDAKIRGNLDFINNDRSELFVEIYERGVLRIGFYYVGADESFYLDLGGLGAGKFKISYIDGQPINLTSMLRNALNGLVDGLVDGSLLGMGSSSGSADAATASELSKMFADGDIVIPYASIGARASAEELDIFGLITTILGNVEINRGDGITEGLLSVKSITAVLSSEIIDMVLGAIAPGLTLPITSIDIYVNFEDDVDFGLGVTIGEKNGVADLISIDLNAKLLYGTLVEDYTMPNFHSDANRADYIPLDENGQLALETVYISLGGEFDLRIPAGEWNRLNISADASSIGLGTLLAKLLIDFHAEIDARYAFILEANVNIGDILQSDLRVAVTDLNTNSVVLELIMTGGAFYLDASAFGIERIKFDLNAVLDGLGVALTSADDGASGGIDIMGIIGAALSGVKLSDTSLEIVLAKNILQAVLNILGVWDGDGSFSISIEDRKGNPLQLGDDLFSNLGLSVNFGEGMDISKLSVNLYASVPDRLNLGLSLGSLRLSLAPQSIKPVNMLDYADIVAHPNIWLAAGAYVDIDLKGSSISLQKMLGGMLANMLSYGTYLDGQEQRISDGARQYISFAKQNSDTYSVKGTVYPAAAELAARCGFTGYGSDAVYILAIDLPRGLIPGGGGAYFTNNEITINGLPGSIDGNVVLINVSDPSVRSFTISYKEEGIVPRTLKFELDAAEFNRKSVEVGTLLDIYDNINLDLDVKLEANIDLSSVLTALLKREPVSGKVNKSFMKPLYVLDQGKYAASSVQEAVFYQTQYVKLKGENKYEKIPDGSYASERYTNSPLYDEGIFGFSLRANGYVKYSPEDTAKVPLYGTVYTTGTQQEADNTQLLLEVKNKNTNTVLFGIYYIGGILYADLSSVGVEKVAISIDIMDLITGLIIKESPALTAAADAGVGGAADQFGTTFLVLLAIQDSGLQLKLAEGLSALLLNLLGVNIPSIVAEAGIETGEAASGMFSKLYLSLSLGDSADNEIMKLELGVNALELGFTAHNISRRSFGLEYSSVDLSNDGKGLSGLYLEASAYVSFEASSTGKDTPEWNLGEWGLEDVLAELLNLGEADPDALLQLTGDSLSSFISKLLIEYQLLGSINSALGIRLALDIRVNPNDYVSYDPGKHGVVYIKTEAGYPLYYVKDLVPADAAEILSGSAFYYNESDAGAGYALRAATETEISARRSIFTIKETDISVLRPATEEELLGGGEFWTYGNGGYVRASGIIVNGAAYYVRSAVDYERTLSGNAFYVYGAAPGVLRAAAGYVYVYGGIDENGNDVYSAFVGDPEEGGTYYAAEIASNGVIDAGSGLYCLDGSKLISADGTQIKAALLLANNLYSAVVSPAKDADYTVRKPDIFVLDDGLLVSLNTAKHGELIYSTDKSFGLYAYADGEYRPARPDEISAYYNSDDIAAERTLYVKNAAESGDALYSQYVPSEHGVAKLTTDQGLGLLYYDPSSRKLKEATVQQTAAGLNLYVQRGFDINYILTHSDIAIEIYNGRYGTGVKVIGVYLFYDGDSASGMPLNSVYIDIDSSFANGVKLKVDGVALGDLLGMSYRESATVISAGASATTSAAGQADGEEYKNNPNGTYETVFGLINGAIRSLSIDSSFVSVNLHENLLNALLPLLFGGTVADAMFNLPLLDGDYSYLRFNVAAMELQVSLALPPFVVGIGLGGLNVSLTSGGIAGVNRGEYKSLQDLSEISLSVSVGLRADLYKSEIPVNDILSAFVSDLALAFNLNIEENLYIDLLLLIEANLNKNSVGENELLIELIDVKGGNTVVFGLYLSGSVIYVQTGSLNAAPFKFDAPEQVNDLVSMLFDLLNNIIPASDEDAALAAAGEVIDSARIIFELAEKNIKLTLVQNLFYALLESFMPSIFGYLTQPSYVEYDHDVHGDAGTFYFQNDEGRFIEDSLENIINAGKTPYVAGEATMRPFFEGLGVALSLAINLEAPSVEISLSSSVLALRISVSDPMIQLARSNLVAGRIANAVAGSFIDFGANPKLYFELEFEIRYNIDAGYEPILKDEEIPEYARYTSYFEYDAPQHFGHTRFYYLDIPARTYVLAEGKNAAEVIAEYGRAFVNVPGSYRQDDYGEYRLRPHDLSPIIGGIAGMDAVSGLVSGLPSLALGGININLSVILTELLQRMGLLVYTNDPVHNAIQVKISAMLDLRPILDKLDLFGLIAGTSSIDLNGILGAAFAGLEVGIQLTANERTVSLYLIRNTLYVDMSAIDGPQFKYSGLDLAALLFPAGLDTPAG